MVRTLYIEKFNVKLILSTLDNYEMFTFEVTKIYETILDVVKSALICYTSDHEFNSFHLLVNTQKSGDFSTTL